MSYCIWHGEDYPDGEECLGCYYDRMEVSYEEVLADLDYVQKMNNGQAD